MTTDSGVKIPFAIRLADGKMVGAYEVERGLACGCSCPACHAELVAVQGEKNVHHFRHHKSSEVLCEYAAETSVRLMLLDILTSANFPTAITFRSPEFKFKVSMTEGDIVESLDEVRPSRDVSVYIHHNDGYPQIFLTLTNTSKPSVEPSCICLYLPAANQRKDASEVEFGFADFSHKWPKRGLLWVNYGVIIKALWRDKDRPITETLITTLFQDPKALEWIYHPAQLTMHSVLTDKVKSKIVQRVRIAEQERQARAEAEFLEAARIEHEQEIKIAYEQARQRKLEEEAEVQRILDHRVRFGCCHICGVILEQASSAKLCDSSDCIAKWEANEDRNEREGIRDQAWAIDQLKRLVLDNGYQTDGPANLYQAPAVRCHDGWLVQTEKFMWFICEHPIQGAGTIPNLIYAGGKRYGFRTARNTEIDELLSSINS